MRKDEKFIEMNEFEKMDHIKKIFDENFTKS